VLGLKKVGEGAYVDTRDTSIGRHLAKEMGNENGPTYKRKKREQEGTSKAASAMGLGHFRKLQNRTSRRRLAGFQLGKGGTGGESGNFKKSGGREVASEIGES